MDWYLVVKYVLILAVTITIGGMFARQLVRSMAKTSEDIKTVASLTQVATRIDRMMVIPASSLILPVGIVLSVMRGWPIFGFLQGASQNWLLASNILLIGMFALIPVVFIPHNKGVEALLQTAVAEGHVTPELSTKLDDIKSRIAHHAEEIIMLAIAALMVLKPF